MDASSKPAILTIKASSQDFSYTRVTQDYGRWLIKINNLLIPIFRKLVRFLPRTDQENPVQFASLPVPQLNEVANPDDVLFSQYLQITESIQKIERDVRVFKSVEFLFSQQKTQEAVQHRLQEFETLKALIEKQHPSFATYMRIRASLPIRDGDLPALSEVKEDEGPSSRLYQWLRIVPDIHEYLLALDAGCLPEAARFNEDQMSALRTFIEDIDKLGPAEIAEKFPKPFYGMSEGECLALATKLESEEPLSQADLWKVWLITCQLEKLEKLETENCLSRPYLKLLHQVGEFLLPSRAKCHSLEEAKANYESFKRDCIAKFPWVEKDQDSVAFDIHLLGVFAERLIDEKSRFFVDLYRFQVCNMKATYERYCLQPDAKPTKETVEEFFQQYSNKIMKTEFQDFGEEKGDGPTFVGRDFLGCPRIKFLGEDKQLIKGEEEDIGALQTYLGVNEGRNAQWMNPALWLLSVNGRSSILRNLEHLNRRVYFSAPYGLTEEKKISAKSVVHAEFDANGNVVCLVLTETATLVLKKFDANKSEAHPTEVTVSQKVKIYKNEDDFTMVEESPSFEMKHLGGSSYPYAIEKLLVFLKGDLAESEQLACLSTVFKAWKEDPSLRRAAPFSKEDKKSLVVSYIRLTTRCEQDVTLFTSLMEFCVKPTKLTHNELAQFLADRDMMDLKEIIAWPYFSLFMDIYIEEVDWNSTNCARLSLLLLFVQNQIPSDPDIFAAVSSVLQKQAPVKERFYALQRDVIAYEKGEERDPVKEIAIATQLVEMAWMDLAKTKRCFAELQRNKNPAWQEKLAQIVEYRSLLEKCIDLNLQTASPKDIEDLAFELFLLGEQYNGFREKLEQLLDVEKAEEFRKKVHSQVELMKKMESEIRKGVAVGLVQAHLTREGTTYEEEADLAQKIALLLNEQGGFRSFSLYLVDQFFSSLYLKAINLKQKDELTRIKYFTMALFLQELPINEMDPKQIATTLVAVETEVAGSVQAKLSEGKMMPIDFEGFVGSLEDEMQEKVLVEASGIRVPYAFARDNMARRALKPFMDGKVISTLVSGEFNCLALPTAISQRVNNKEVERALLAALAQNLQKIPLFIHTCAVAGTQEAMVKDPRIVEGFEVGEGDVVRAVNIELHEEDGQIVGARLTYMLDREVTMRIARTDEMFSLKDGLVQVDHQLSLQRTQDGFIVSNLYIDTSPSRKQIEEMEDEIAPIDLSQKEGVIKMEERHSIRFVKV